MATDSKEYLTVLSTDMSKAFDSLHPALMIQKLKAYSGQSLNANRRPTYSDLLTRAGLPSLHHQRVTKHRHFNV